MFQRIESGWALAKQSFAVLKTDRQLLLFPLLSGIACLMVLVSFALPLWQSGALETYSQGGTEQLDAAAYAGLFVFYFANYFVITFFNTALIGCVMMRFEGKNPGVSDGFRIASGLLPQIIGWSLMSATIGLLLRIIESRSQRVGQIIAALLGMAWTATSYFVLPVFVYEKLGPIDAFKKSVGILKKTWGESLVANFGIGIITFIFMLIALIPAFLGLLAQSAMAAMIGITLTVLSVILVMLISSAAKVIIQAALYEYASRQNPPPQFDATALGGAFVPR